MKVLIGSNPMGLESAIPEFEKEFPEVTFEHCTDRGDGLMEAIADADVYVGWLSRDHYLAAKQLKWIQSPSSGINYYLAIPELVDSDVLLTSARGTHSACLAESVMGMILAFTRGIREFVIRQERHEWSGRELRCELREFARCTMGIVGFGTVGRATAERAAAFGLRILAVDAFPGAHPDTVEAVWGLDRLDEMLAQSDYVVITVPYTPQTEGMIGAHEIAQIKQGAILVGISRGKIIDEDALIEALESGHLDGAALDVFAREPLPEDSPLWDVPNLLITPHAAGGTQYEGEYIIEILRENLHKFLNGDLPLRNQIDKQRGF